MASQGWWEKSRVHQSLSAVLRFFVPSSLRATNAPVDGYVPSKAAGEDLFTWIAPGGGGGGQVDSIVEGDGIDVDATDPVNPTVSVFLSTDMGNTLSFGTDNGLLNTGGGSSVQSPGCVFSNGNLLLTGTLTDEIFLPYGGTISSWTIGGDAAGSASIIVSYALYASYATMTTLFTATCTTSNKAQATGLSHTLPAGSFLRFSGSGFALFTRVSIVLEVN
jgi:hypothetical protein